MIPAILCIFPSMLHLFVFQNKPLDINHQFDDSLQYQEIWLDLDSNQRVHSLLLSSNQDQKKGIIIYYHGNAGNLERWSKEADRLTKYGYDVLVVDYPGYGKSEGKPSEQGFYSTAKASLAWLQEQSYNKTIIYGRSLGSAVALYASTQFRSDMTILETTFYDMPTLVKKRFFPARFYYPSNDVSFPNHKYIQNINTPIHILQGDKDRITPLSEAQKLIPLLKADDSFTLIKGGTHRNLSTTPAYRNKLNEILQ